MLALAWLFAVPAFAGEPPRSVHPMKLEEIPAPARAEIERQAGYDRVISNVRREESSRGITTYDAELTRLGRDPIDLAVSADGHTISRSKRRPVEGTGP
jgi:hypothetical protein